MDRGEVYSLACLGLCEAVHKHDTTRGAFSTIAYWVMNSRINNALKFIYREKRTPLRLVRLGDRQLRGRIDPGFARVDNLDSLARAERFL
jgi:DNA-directed RNA polymerase sigma subunit (sigma70/sigma32)